MKQFKDSKNRDWSIEITVAAMKRVRDLAGVNLYDLGPQGAIHRIDQDVILLGAVLWSLVVPQARALGIGEEDFGEALAGDAIAKATLAMLEELADFFPNPAVRRSLHKTFAAARAMAEKSDAALEQRMDQTLQQLQAPAPPASDNASTPPASSDSSGVRPASSELTPAH